MKIDFNADMGESYGLYLMGNDGALLDIVSSCNVACGFHAGDVNTMMQTVTWALEKGVSIGAHPGFDDLYGFGRREINHSPEEVYRLVLYQIGALDAFVKAKGGRLNHVKAHGALYNMACKDRNLADAYAQAVKDYDDTLVLFGLYNSELIEAGEAIGLQTAKEAFADRTYQKDGSLTPRTKENAVLHDTEAVIRQVFSIAKDGVVQTADGEKIEVAADTICFHGDTKEALEHAQACKNALEEEGIQIKTTFGM